MTAKQHIVVSVTNDLVSDQRVHKVCTTLSEMGYDVMLIGRKLSHSLPIKRNYATQRMRLLFNKGFLFYAEYNLRLFFKLCFQKKDILLSNDLDTLLPNFLVSRLFNTRLVYDSHELFTEIPELTARPTVKKVWLAIEKFIFPKLKTVYTVNQSIASVYQKKYGVAVKVIRNIAPSLKNSSLDKSLSDNSKGNRKMLILQGTGINIDRGAEETVQMMQYLENTVLFIIGGGDVFDKLKVLIRDLDLKDKVILKNKIPYEELMEYTKVADLGLSLDKNTNLNYEYSLPNKVFDYIQAQTPLFVSNRKEIASLVSQHNIGFVVESHNPKILANHITEIFFNVEMYQTWKQNLKNIADDYCWEKESENLKKIFQKIE